MATKEKSAVVNLPELKLENFTLRIVGDSPLISHVWSEKAKLIDVKQATEKSGNG